MKKQPLIFKQRLFSKLLVSYLVVLFITALFTIGLSFYNMKTVSDYAEEGMLNSLEQFKTFSDERMKGYEQLATEISFDKKVVSVMSTDKNVLSPAQHYYIKEIKDTLTTYCVTNSSIDSLALFVPSLDQIISNRGLFEADEKAFLYNKTYSTESISDGASLLLYNYFEATDYRKISLQIPITKFSANGKSAHLIIECNLSDISQISPLQNSLQYALLSKNEQRSLDELNLPLSESAINGVLSLNRPNFINTDKSFMYSYAESTEYPIIYLCFVSDTLYNQSLRSANLLFAYLIALMLFIGLSLSGYFAFTTYKPIKNISNQFTAKKMESLQEIENAVAELAEENRFNSQISQDYQKALQESFLLKLLHDEVKDNTTIKHFLDKYEISFPYHDFVVCAATCSENALITEKTDKIVTKTNELFLNKNIQTVFIPTKSSVKFIFNLEALDNGVNNLNKLSELLPIADTIAVSDVFKSVFDLSKAYDEVKSVLESMEFVGKNGLAFYSDTKSLSRVSNSNVDSLQKKFSIALLEQDFDEVLCVKEQLFTEFISENYSTDLIKVKLFSLIDETLRTIDAIKITHASALWTDLHIFDRLIGCRNLEQINTTYDEIINSISGIIQDNFKRLSMPQRVKNYINENYADQNLSVAVISEQMGVSASYLAREFKKESELSILQYIQSVRIAEAKKIITKNPDATLVSLAEKTGFYSDAAFIRVFKKYELQTPGKYRDSQKSDD